MQVVPWTKNLGQLLTWEQVVMLPPNCRLHVTSNNQSMNIAMQMIDD